MYIVARFDSIISPEAREAILQSEFINTILKGMFYLNPEQDSVAEEQYEKDIEGGKILIAHDGRGPVTHMSITDTRLPKDLVYMCITDGAKLFKTQEDLIALLTVPEHVWETAEQTDAAEVIRVDLSELEVNVGRAHRGNIANIGEISAICACWNGGAGEIYMQSMQASYDDLCEVAEDELSS